MLTGVWRHPPNHVVGIAQPTAAGPVNDQPPMAARLALTTTVRAATRERRHGGVSARSAAIVARPGISAWASASRPAWRVVGGWWQRRARVSSSADIRPLTSTFAAGQRTHYTGCWVTPKFAQTDPSVSANWVKRFHRVFVDELLHCGYLIQPATDGASLPGVTRRPITGASPWHVSSRAPRTTTPRAYPAGFPRESHCQSGFGAELQLGGNGLARRPPGWR